MDVLKTDHLFKSIHNTKIINDITFSLSESEIVGFVGPNGAGKTTTIRLITNQVFPDSGTVNICGYDLVKERESALHCVSAVTENTGLYPYLTGIEHFRFIAKMHKISKAKIEDIIEFSGLSTRINDKVCNYSLGMKQRLLLSNCLLTSPQLLILDEPTNGLDPTGIIELREKLIDLSKNKKMTIFISSHLLSEIEKVCDRIIFIKEGTIIQQKNSGEKFLENRQTYKLNISNSSNLNEFLADKEYVFDYSLNNGQLTITINNSKLGELLNCFSQSNIVFSNIALVPSTIENDYSQIFDKHHDIS